VADKNPAELIRGERDWLATILTELGKVDVPDLGLDLTCDPPQGELVYEVPYGRFEVTVRRIDG